jgi:hypothetical protein
LIVKLGCGEEERRCHQQQIFTGYSYIVNNQQVDIHTHQSGY